MEGAAERAWRRGAPDAAAHLLRTACRLTPSADQDALALRRVALGRMLYHAGDPVDAVTELESLLDALPPGPIRARVLYHLMYVARPLGGMNRSVAYGLQAAQEAADDPAFQSEVYEWLSRQADNDSALKLETARKALEALERVPDPDPELAFYARAALVEADFYAGRGIRLDLLEDAPTETKPRFPPVRTASFGDDLVGRLLGFAGRIDEARTVLRGLFDRAAVQNRSLLPAVLGWMSVVEILSGEFTAAESLTAEAIERVEETGNRGMLLWVLGYRGIALAALGRLDEAQSAVARALDMNQGDTGLGEDPDRCLPLLGLGMADMARGRFLEAAEHLRVFDRAMRAVGLREPRWSMHAPELVESLIGAGELDEAAEVLARFEEDAERSAGEWSLATSARCRALLCAAEGRLDDALEAADQSLKEYRDLPFRFERARSLLAKGQIHRRRREKRLAREVLNQALESFQELGTPLWADRARGELARIPVRRTLLELTPTEEKVAALAAAGLTNKEIAGRAFLSPKTVDNVLGRVYRKLHIRSRAELGAEMIERAGSINT